MTTFAQHPDNEAPDVPCYTAPEPHSHQYMPNQQAQQQMRQPAPPTQQYPPEDQHYLQSRYAGPESMQNQHPVYPAMSSYVQPPGESYYGQQLRPSLDQRRSEASFRSTHSHKSTWSTDSHRSHHSTRSHESSRSHTNRSHHTDRDANQESKNRKKRDLDARPTMGDSVMLVVNHVRDLLSSDRQ
ncbi:hypothetical protein AUEXF2481DRAFT_26229 [Aureobasidium subglaciale EXF-2481]|uniref:Uncharacterized protein n=1 Tax=Aureobasidium subglaciale (strain EXF-2481) TaxID=1043005 RepID=A0A074YS48_AURSE|nr:uncharacterized protein AUEXF2481DRAFT_26229 [Aureobasidium subglaciale EXF-2481]KEQ98994.1 hypothetical protein AUEXF2481DRAFT_26229 [Aureobasidium subglaciale EXF-2481]